MKIDKEKYKLTMEEARLYLEVWNNLNEEQRIEILATQALFFEILFVELNIKIEQHQDFYFNKKIISYFKTKDGQEVDFNNREMLIELFKFLYQKDISPFLYDGFTPDKQAEIEAMINRADWNFKITTPKLKLSEFFNLKDIKH
jgi:hypothetical protein